VSRLPTIELKVSKHVQIFDRQFDNKGVLVSDPSIALDAAN
jgi:hypothetical protein